MSEKHKFSRSLSGDSDKLKEEDGGASPGCGVSEEQFPCDGKCCDKNTTKAGNVYKRKCPYCRIMVSVPDTVALRLNYIIECDLYFYGKRISKN